jgi:fluoride exporter
MTQLLWILLGGAIGTGCRFGVNLLIAHLLGSPARFPYATFIVNVTGSFAIGLLAELFAMRWPTAELLRTALLVGVLGGYTTFSSFSLETLALIRNNQWLLAGIYALGSVLTGLLAVWAGTIVARWF